MKLGFRIWVLIAVLILAILSISPWKSLDKGVLIENVNPTSISFQEGLRQGQIIISVDGNNINNFEDFNKIIQSKNYSNQIQKTIITTKESEFILFSNESLGLTVTSLPKSNIKTGLDLSGGSKALVKAKDKELTSSEVSDLVEVISNRLNVYGIADVVILPVSDLSGDNFVSIEIAGATPSDLENLISQQGKFEAKIGNDTIFIGGNKDVASVCRNDATCAYIESCNPLESEEYYCNFRFSVYLSEEAAKRHSTITQKLDLDPTNPQYLSQKLDLYLDDVMVDSLFIGKDLKGSVTTQISISGSGSGETQEDAYNSAEESMHKLQTVLITGSLPYKLEIVKLDTLSPNLGKEFTKNIILLGAIVFLIISVILFIKYRKIKITLSVILTMFSEAFITLGIAAFIGWNLDAPSIAGIIAGMGTGVNDQIVIIDESVSNKKIILKERIKNALFIIFGAFFTIIAAVLPLFWAGAGMLKGFALTTILSVSVGILITRPAFAELIRRIESD